MIEFAQSSTHEQDQLCEMMVCHIALQRYSDSQLHLCWKAVCRQDFLFDSCSNTTAVLSIAFFITNMHFFQHALTLGGLKGIRGNSISVTQALWKCM